MPVSERGHKPEHSPANDADFTTEEWKCLGMIGRRVIFLPTGEVDLHEYEHPNGYRIERSVRDWDGRGYRGTMASDPKVQWLVYRGARMLAYTPLFRTLRQAKAWCDANPEAEA